MPRARAVALLLAGLSTGLAGLATPGPADAAPLTLDDALALAARRNADLLQARADVDLARADVQGARAAVLPRLDLAASFGREAWGDGPVATAAGVEFPLRAGDQSAYAASLSAAQPLVDLARTRALRQAGETARASERQADETALAVAFQVVQRFHELVKQERSLSVLERTAARSGELVERADALFTAGRTPKSETYAARVNLQNDLLAAEAQRLRVEQARVALAQVLGVDRPDGLAVVAPAGLDGSPPAEDPPPLEELVPRARARRPGLAAEASRLAAARAGVGVAGSGFYPSLALQASYARSGQRLSGRNGVYGDPSRVFTATGEVVLSWNLFQGFGTEAAVRRAEAGVARAQALAQRADEAVAQEVTSARAALVALSRQEKLAAAGLAVARDALRLATERFTAGLATQLEERDASLKLSQAELTLLEARIDHAVARADLARAMGGAP